MTNNILMGLSKLEHNWESFTPLMLHFLAVAQNLVKVVAQ